MVRTITKIGNSCGLIFDRTLLDLTHLKLGDEVNITVHDGGSVTIEPAREVIKPERAAELAKSLVGANSELFRRLSQ